jgi:hypothetical protein
MPLFSLWGVGPTGWRQGDIYGISSEISSLEKAHDLTLNIREVA